MIRVWAGDKGSEESDPDWWDQVIDDSKRIGDMAKKANIIFAYEYHDNTLTDTLESTQKLFF